MGKTETVDEINPQFKARLTDFSERYQNRLSVGAMKTLLALAYNGPKTQYSLAKLTNMRYASVHSTISILCKLGLTKKTAEQESEKGVKTYLYSLTEQGLLSLLSRVPTAIPASLSRALGEQEDLIPAKAATVEDISDIRNLKSHMDIFSHLYSELDIDLIAKTYATYFPLVFGKWSMLKQMKIVSWHKLPEIAFQALCDHYYFGYAQEKDLSLDFTHKFYTYRLKTMIELAEPKEFQNTRQTISELLKDPELGELLKGISKEILTSLKRQAWLLNQTLSDF